MVEPRWFNGEVAKQRDNLRALDESTAAEAVRGTPAQAIFRTPGIAYLAVLMFAVGATPFAGAAPGLQAIYAVPLFFLVWIVRVRTTANGHGLTVRRLFSTRHLAWVDLKGLTITRRARVRAVPSEGGEVTLPSVRPRHLPLLSLVSGGRVPAPTAAAETACESDARS
jgi:hypothetical protein